MTVPATLSITSASIGFLAALLAFGLSLGPGWRSLRWFALCALLAALFSLASVPITLRVSEDFLLFTSRFDLCCAGLHAATWFKYTAAHYNRSLSRAERMWVAGGVMLSFLTLVPGLIVSNSVQLRHIDLFDLTYVDAPPTKLGTGAMAYYVASVVFLLVRELRTRLAGDTSATTRVIALGAVFLGGVHDAFANMGLIGTPYLLDLSLLVLVITVGGSITSRFVASARALEASSRKLEAAHQELIQKERLAALGELAAVVAHEVRNPLAVVFNATAGLRRSQPGSPDHGALLSIVQEEAERLRDIISDLLEFARPRPPVLGTAPFNDIIRGAVEAACNGAGATTSDVKVELKDDVGRVTCDDRLVRQAVVNLVTNALQTAGRRGPVLVGISEDPVRQVIAVRVTDDGEGVAEELRDRIFTPFFSTRPKGTGLGLTVVRRCADAHGGDVVLLPTPGGGATFELQLPRRDA